MPDDFFRRPRGYSIPWYPIPEEGLRDFAVEEDLVGFVEDRHDFERTKGLLRLVLPLEGRLGWCRAVLECLAENPARTQQQVADTLGCSPSDMTRIKPLLQYVIEISEELYVKLSQRLRHRALRRILHLAVAGKEPEDIATRMHMETDDVMKALMRIQKISRQIFAEWNV